jgi:ubiquitin-large subunit ribosomal protein L40e
MQIFVKGFDGKSLTFIVQSDDTVRSLKDKIKERVGCVNSCPTCSHYLTYLIRIRAPLQRLIYLGKELENERLLTYYRVEKESTLWLVARLEGGSQFNHEWDGL